MFSTRRDLAASAACIAKAASFLATYANSNNSIAGISTSIPVDGGYNTSAISTSSWDMAQSLTSTTNTNNNTTASTSTGKQNKTKNKTNINNLPTPNNSSIPHNSDLPRLVNYNSILFPSLYEIKYCLDGIESIAQQLHMKLNKNRLLQYKQCLLMEKVLNSSVDTHTNILATPVITADNNNTNNNNNSNNNDINDLLKKVQEENHTSILNSSFTTNNISQQHSEYITNSIQLLHKITSKNLRDIKSIKYVLSDDLKRTYSQSSTNQHPPQISTSALENINMEESHQPLNSDTTHSTANTTATNTTTNASASKGLPPMLTSIYNTNKENMRKIRPIITAEIRRRVLQKRQVYEAHILTLV